MDGMEIVSQLVSTVGFPIVAYLLMVKTNNDLNKQHREEVREMNESFAVRNDKVIEALENNTRAVSELSAFMKGKNENA